MLDLSPAAETHYPSPEDQQTAAASRQYKFPPHHSSSVFTLRTNTVTAVFLLCDCYSYFQFAEDLKYRWRVIKAHLNQMSVYLPSSRSGIDYTSAVIRAEKTTHCRFIILPWWERAVSSVIHLAESRSPTFFLLQGSMPAGRKSSQQVHCCQTETRMMIIKWNNKYEWKCPAFSKLRFTKQIRWLLVEQYEIASFFLTLNQTVGTCLEAFLI